jgi:hypothetical protein
MARRKDPSPIPGSDRLFPARQVVVAGPADRAMATMVQALENVGFRPMDVPAEALLEPGQSDYLVQILVIGSDKRAFFRELAEEMIPFLIFLRRRPGTVDSSRCCVVVAPHGPGRVMVSVSPVSVGASLDARGWFRGAVDRAVAAYAAAGVLAEDLGWKGSDKLEPDNPANIQYPEVKLRQWKKGQRRPTR